MAAIADHDIWKKCLKGAGEFIVANADDLVGETDDLTSVTVTITLNPNEAPIVNVDRDYIPKECL